MSSTMIVHILSFRGNQPVSFGHYRTSFTQEMNQRGDYGHTYMLDKYCRITSCTGGPKLLDSHHLSRLSDGLSKLRNWLLLRAAYSPLMSLWLVGNE